MLKYKCVTFCLLTTLLWGCSGATDSTPNPEVPEAGDAVSPMKNPEAGPVPEGQTEVSAANAEVTLDIKSWDETAALVANSKGKVVVVDLWATYCGPCLVEFPNLVKLHQEHQDQVTCLSVSLDYQGFEGQPVESYVDPVLGVLKSKQATFQNILCSTDSDTMYNEKLKVGSIPIVMVFDRTGKLVAHFPNPEDPAEFTYQSDVLPLVQKLLSDE